jgi:dihydrofolate reductase
MKRNLVVFMHLSLDGFVAGPNGEMDWIHVDEEMFDYAARQTQKSDIALYGRITYEMMENYWPTAANQPNASKHDIEHSTWYNSVSKVIVSKTMQGQKRSNTTIISDNLYDEIIKLKSQPGKDIVMFGSPSVVHSLLPDNLIDDFWLFINPILLGEGIPLFKNIRHKTKLKLIEATILSSGVMAVNYERKRDLKDVFL